MNIIIALYSALLFFLLTPAILVRIPKNGSKRTVAMVHALVFAVLLWGSCKIFRRLGIRTEGMTTMPKVAKK
jgi:hypothetical protein